MSDSVRPHRQQPTRLPRPWDSPGENTGVSCHFLLQCMKVKSESEVAQSCPTLWNPMDCSLPGSPIHGIFQARVLEWVAIFFSWPELKVMSPGCSLEGLMLKLKLPILWPPDAKSWLIGKDPDAGRDWGQEEKGMTEDETARWHHWLDGHEFE